MNNSVDLVIVNNAILSPTVRGIMIILLFDYKYFGRHVFPDRSIDIVLIRFVLTS